MALVLDAVPMSTTCNSYATVAEADEYVATKVAVASVSTTWDALDDATKILYLVRATEFLDGMVSWFGDRYSTLSNLKWPRLNFYIEGLIVTTFNLTSFPQKIKYATIEMALFLLQESNATSEVDDNVAYESVEMGPLKVNFNLGDNNLVQKFYPDVLPILLKDYGEIENPNLPKSNRISQVKLIRT